MEQGLLNKIWATANIRYSVIAFFSLEDIGSVMNAISSSMSLCRHTTSFWQPFPFVLRYPHCEKLAGKEMRYDNHGIRRQLLTISPAVSFELKSNLPPFPPRACLMLFPFTTCFLSHRIEQTWYDIYEAVKIRSEATVRQFYQCVKETQWNELLQAFINILGLRPMYRKGDQNWMHWRNVMWLIHIWMKLCVEQSLCGFAVDFQVIHVLWNSCNQKLVHERIQCDQLPDFLGQNS